MESLKKQVNGSHYKDMKIQVVEYCFHNNIPFMEGAIIKYVSRWRNKGGIDDLKKAKHFIEMLIELEYEQTKTTNPTSGIIPGGVIQTSGRVIDIRGVDADGGRHTKDKYSPCINT